MNQDELLYKYLTESTNESQEPIKVVRPRYVASQLDDNSAKRGERASIKILAPRETGYSYSNFSVVSEATKNKFDTEGFASFFMQNISAAYSEKTQVLQTFGGSDVVYYFGQAPVQINISGLLFDDITNQWFVEFCRAYQEIMRGTRLAQNQHLVDINTPSMRIVGSINSLSHNQDASRDTDIAFSISVHAQSVEYKTITFDGIASNATGEIVGKLNLPDPNEPTPTLTAKDINQAKEAVASLSLGETKAKLEATTLYSNEIATPEETATLSGVSGFEGFLDFLGASTSPTVNVLGAALDMSNMAQAISVGVEAASNKIANVVVSHLANGPTAESLMRGAKGTIASSPESLASHLSRYIQDGVIDKSSDILSGALSASETSSILASRPKRTGDEGATL